MFSVDFIQEVFLGIFTILVTYFFWRVKRMEIRIDECTSAEKEVESKVEVVKNDQDGIKEDLRYMRQKIDKISEYLLTGKAND